MSKEQPAINKLGAWAFFLVFVVTIYRCAGSDTSESDRQDVYAQPIDSHAIALVRETQKEKPGHKFITAPFKNGVAVLANNIAGYWVLKEKVFAVNGIAKNWSPDINYSPADVSYPAMIESIESYQHIKIE